MAGYIPKTLTKIPPDIEEFYDTSSMQLSVRSKTQTAANLSEENEHLQMLQNKQKSIANLAVILNLMNIQASLKKNPEILTILTNQKVNLNEILI